MACQEAQAQAREANACIDATNARANARVIQAHGALRGLSKIMFGFDSEDMMPTEGSSASSPPSGSSSPDDISHIGLVPSSGASPLNKSVDAVFVVSLLRRAGRV